MSEVVIVDTGAADASGKCMACPWSVIPEDNWDYRAVQREAKRHVAETGHRVATSARKMVQFAPAIDVSLPDRKADPE